jgi:predicted Zn-dependent protease
MSAWRLVIEWCLLISLFCGCSAPRFLKRPTGPDVSPARAERRAQATKQFEAHYDTALYEAAMDRWQSGDAAGCEAQLRGLLGRNPQHLAGRRALADLAMERGDTVAAEKELRDLLALASEDAQTHHSLGMLLESLGRFDEAQVELRRASELSPENGLYQLCLQNYPAAPSAPVVTVR